MADVNDYLGPLKPWFAGYCFPLVDALYAENLQLAQAALDQAWQAHAAAARRPEAPLDADGLRALEYVLIEFDYELANQFDAPQTREVHQAVYRLLLQLPPCGPLSDTVQAFIQLSLIGMGTRRGFVTASAEQVETLVARVPEAVRTPNFWYYVVAWAYFNDYLPLLEQAYTDQMTRTTGWQDEYYWMRTNLMYLLVSGRAQSNDLEQTIRAYEHPRQIVDFRNLFLARAAAQGIWTPELAVLLAERETELEKLRGQLPRFTARTRRIRGSGRVV